MYKVAIANFPTVDAVAGTAKGGLIMAEDWRTAYGREKMRADE